MKGFKLFFNIFLILLVFTSLIFAQEPVESTEVLTEETQEVITEDEENPDSSEETGDEEITEEPGEDEENSEDKPLLLNYQTHVQDYGWREICSNGQSAGSVGEAKRMEAIVISCENMPRDMNIEYSTHVENIGWSATRS